MIFFCGDNHSHFGHIIEAVHQHRPDAIVLLGDIEAQRPLEQELAQIMDLTAVWWIPGNHDTDSQANHDNLFGSALADRNLHGRVVEIAGLKVAGLGGVFRGEIWYPDSQGAQVHYESYPDYQTNSEPGRIHAAAQHRAIRRGEMSEVKARGKLLTHRSSIFYADWLELHGQRADILVTHEAPSCHPNGFKALDELARALHVKASFHGHHHDRLNYQPHWDTLGFQAHGVGFCGITDQYGGMVVAGKV
jgi:predicted MPP superfamily phosphohydrolase